MRALSKDEIFKETEDMKIENDYLHNGVTDSRDPNFRWNGPVGTLPDHHSLATADIKERQARQAAHDDRLRAALTEAEAAKGSPLKFAERQIVLKELEAADKPKPPEPGEGIRRQFHPDGTWGEIAPLNKHFR